jgi:hypothetical protein
MNEKPQDDITRPLDKIVRHFFSAKLHVIAGWNGIGFSTWTPLERYSFGLYPPPRHGCPATDHLWLLRIDSRKSGTGFQYAESPEKLLAWAKAKMTQERRLDRAFYNARNAGDHKQAQKLELARFLRYPITA